MLGSSLFSARINGSTARFPIRQSAATACSLTRVFSSLKALIRASIAFASLISPRARIAVSRTRMSPNFRAVMSGSTAGAPISMRAHTACSLIRESSSFRAAMRGAIEAVPISLRENTAFSRTLESSSFSAPISGSMARVSFISPSVSAACQRIWGFPCFRESMRRSIAGSPISLNAHTALSLTRASSSLNAAISGSIAATPISPSAQMAFQRTSESLSFRAVISGSIDRTSFIFPRASTEFCLTCGSPSLNAAISGSTALSSFILTGLIISPFFYLYMDP